MKLLPTCSALFLVFFIGCSSPSNDRKDEEKTTGWRDEEKIAEISSQALPLDELDLVGNHMEKTFGDRGKWLVESGPEHPDSVQHYLVAPKGEIGPGNLPVNYVGTFDVFHKDGAPFSGWAKSIKSNGSLYWIRQYKDGLADGNEVSWQDNGELKAIGSYKEGKRDGQWIYFDAEGKEKSSSLWKDGTLDLK
jgi:hypothetical protein